MDFFKCSLCKNSYDNNQLLPRMMPDCGHTFCSNCIEDRLAIGQVICPEDDLTYRNLNSIEDFPVNTTLVSILKKNVSTNGKTNSNTNTNTNSNKQFLSPNQKRSEFTRPMGNKSFEIKPSRMQEAQASHDADEELKNLLTPSDFLKNLLGSMKIQQQQEQRQEQRQEQPKSKQKARVDSGKKQYEAMKMQEEEQEPEFAQGSFTSFSASPQTLPKSKPLGTNFSNSEFQLEDSLQNTKTASYFAELPRKEESGEQKYSSRVESPNDAGSRPVVRLIDSIKQNSTRNSQKDGQVRQAIIEQKVKLEDQVKRKFGEQIDKLQAREGQVLREIGDIYDKIQARFSERADQLEQAAKVCSKVTLEFQLQLELIIPRYCTVKNHINPAKDYEHDLPTFAQEPIKSTSSSERDTHHQPQSFAVANEHTPPASRFPNSFQKTVKTEPSEYDFPSFHNKAHFANDRNPLPDWSTAQKQPRVSPARRIFEDPQPMSKPLQVVNKNHPPQDSTLEVVIHKLQQGINIEEVNLKDQHLGDQEVHSLAAAIKKTVSFVRSIKLSRNRITDNGLQNLLHAINSNKTIKTLNLKKNKLTENTLDLIIQTYQYGKTNYLSQLYLKGNQISVQKHIAKLTTIQQLGIVIYL